MGHCFKLLLSYRILSWFLFALPLSVTFNRIFDLLFPQLPNEISSAQYTALLVMRRESELNSSEREWLPQSFFDLSQELFLGEVSHKKDAAPQDDGIGIQNISFGGDGHGQVLDVFDQERMVFK